MAKPVSPRDYTGLQRAVLTSEAKAAQEDAAHQLTMITAAAEEAKHGTIEIGTPKEVVTVDDDGAPVVVAEKMKKFRVNTTLEKVTIGVGNHFDFVEGQKYKAPKYVYDHLNEKGYIWH